MGAAVLYDGASDHLYGPQFAGLLSGWRSQVRLRWPILAEPGCSAYVCDSQRKQHQRKTALVLAFPAAPDSAPRVASGACFLHSRPTCTVSHGCCSCRMSLSHPLVVDHKGFRTAGEGMRLSTSISFRDFRRCALFGRASSAWRGDGFRNCHRRSPGIRGWRVMGCARVMEIVCIATLIAWRKVRVCALYVWKALHDMWYCRCGFRPPT